jgi:hypothetical protein
MEYLTLAMITFSKPRKITLKIFTVDKNKLLVWGKLIGIIGGSQVIIQGVGLIAGILTVRLLSIKEYAFFTLANTMLGALAVISDGGISSGVMSEAGKKWTDKVHVGLVLYTGMQLRKKFALIALVFTLPFLTYLLLDNGAKPWQVFLVLLAMIPSFFATISDSLLEIPLKINQDILPLQKNQLFASIGRLLLSITSLFFLPFSFIALLSNCIPRLWANIKLRKIILPYAETRNIEDQQIKATIMSVVKRSMPGSIYFVFSGQINIWILSLIGNTNGLAQIGAIGRISVLFSTLSLIGSTLITPRFSRLPMDTNILKKRFFEIQAIALISCMVLLALVSLMPSELLYILGNQYNGLEQELIINIASSLMGIMVGLTFGLLLSRGWVIYPVVSISINILAFVFGVVLFEVKTLMGVSYLTLLQGTVMYVQLLIFGSIKTLGASNQQTSVL